MRSPFYVSVIIALLTSVGCSKKASEDGGDAGQCTAAIGKAVETMMSSRKRMAESSAATQVADKLRGALITRCTEDKWAASVVTCFASASDFASIRECEKGLTPEQNQRRQSEVMKVMMAGRQTGRPAPSPTPAPAPSPTP